MDLSANEKGGVREPAPKLRQPRFDAAATSRGGGLPAGFQVVADAALVALLLAAAGHRLVVAGPGRVPGVNLAHPGRAAGWPRPRRQTRGRSGRRRTRPRTSRSAPRAAAGCV